MVHAPYLPVHVLRHQPEAVLLLGRSPQPGARTLRFVGVSPADRNARRAPHQAAAGAHRDRRQRTPNEHTNRTHSGAHTETADGRRPVRG
jgi:hypothetical protein